MNQNCIKSLTQQIQNLTDLDNPNSVAQMKGWLSDNGLEMDTLGKKAVAETLKTAPKHLADVLSLRQQLAKSSVKKYTAMQTAVCKDSRATLKSLGVGGYHLHFGRKLKCGIDAYDFDVHLEEEEHGHGHDHDHDHMLPTHPMMQKD